VKFTLRSYAPQDFENLFEIDQQCFEKEIAYSRRDMRAYLKFPGAECVVAETSRGTMAGFCIGIGRGQLGYVVTMDVLPQYRRKGAARELLAEIERRLGGRDVREVWLETATDNEAAIAFWLKHGYRKRGIREGYYPDGRDAFTMQKVLANQQGGEAPGV
jgi:ribosomal-protein-alanine N-acetyltransferase